MQGIDEQHVIFHADKDERLHLNIYTFCVRYIYETFVGNICGKCKIKLHILD